MADSRGPQPVVATGEPCVDTLDVRHTTLASLVVAGRLVRTADSRLILRLDKPRRELAG